MSKGTAKHEPVKITVDFLNKVKPPVEGYDYRWDRTVKGYGVRLAPTGKKVFVVQGRVKGTRAPLEAVSAVVKHPLSCHDLRRTFVSVGVAVCGVDLYKMELLTNHVPKGVTAKHYLKTSRLQYLQPEVQRIGDWIEEQGRIAEAKVNATNVVSLAA